jgi:competence protein ComEA
MEGVRRWGVIGLLGILGLGLVGYGVWEQIKPSEVVVEIIKDHSQITNSQINQLETLVVDVAGAVEKPGVYKLSSGSRIGDALVVAGGLAASADREWVAGTLNLAQKLTDGEKVYIPSNSQITNPNRGSNPASNKKININTASVSELDGLEGIGEARAQAIVANRPYSKIEELVSKAKIPQSVYEKISSSISVY